MQMFRFAIAAVLTTAGLQAVAQTSTEWANKDTQFCLLQSSTRTLVQMPADRPHCAALQVAGAAVIYFSGNKELADLLMTSNQRDWGLAAIRMACLPGGVGRQPAIRLIQACQCENANAIATIENNQDEVIRVLRVRSGRNPAYPGCEDAPDN